MITIDGTIYNIGITKINRSADVLDKFAERVENGTLNRDLIGVYFNFTLEFGMSIENVTEYASLFNKVTEAVKFHTVIMPTPTEEPYSAYFANIKDEPYKWKEGEFVYFRKLSFSVIAQSPHITP